MSFAAEFRAVCVEVSDLVHQLAGVEKAYEFFLTHESSYSYSIEHPELDFDVQVQASNATVPTDYPFQPSWARHYAMTSGGNTLFYRAEDQIRLAFEQAWTPDVSYTVSMCDLVIQAHVDAMVTRCHSLSDAAVNLYSFAAAFDTDGDGSSMPGFAQDLQSTWRSGLAGTGFFTFYEDLTDLVTRYATAALQLAGTSAAVTNVIDQFQKNVLENAEKTRDLAREVLKKWQSNERPVEVSQVDVDHWALDVLSGTSLATGTLGLIPGPQQLALGTVSGVTGILSYVATSVAETKVVPLPTSGDIHQNLYDALRSSQEEMLKALDQLHTADTVPGSGDEAVPVTVIPFNQFVQDSEGNDGWKPPGVEF